MPLGVVAFVARIQRRITNVDIASYERGVEGGAEDGGGGPPALDPRRAVARKEVPSGRPKPQLIDVDLVRGGVFKKEGRRSTHVGSRRRARVLRVLAFGLFPRFWSREASVRFWLFGSLVYLAYYYSLWAWFVTGRLPGTVSAIELLHPACCLALVAALYAQVTAAAAVGPEGGVDVGAGPGSSGGCDSSSNNNNSNSNSNSNSSSNSSSTSTSTSTSNSTRTSTSRNGGGGAQLRPSDGDSVFDSGGAFEDEEDLEDEEFFDDFDHDDLDSVILRAGWGSPFAQRRPRRRSRSPNDEARQRRRSASSGKEASNATGHGFGVSGGDGDVGTGSPNGQRASAAGEERLSPPMISTAPEGVYRPVHVIDTSGPGTIRVKLWAEADRPPVKIEASLTQLHRYLHQRVLVTSTASASRSFAYGGALFSVVLALVPPFFRLGLRLRQACSVTAEMAGAAAAAAAQARSDPLMAGPLASQFYDSPCTMQRVREELGASGSSLRNVTAWSRDVAYILLGGAPDQAAADSRLLATHAPPWESCVAVLSSALCVLVAAAAFLLSLAAAERVFSQRVLYAKFFTALTSSRKCCRLKLPHFRLHKVANIKMWLSLRSLVRRRGPQHSLDSIVSMSFLLAIFDLAFMSWRIIVYSSKSSLFFDSVLSVLCFSWATVLTVFLLRFTSYGSKINRKYQSNGVLLTEQINLYLRQEERPGDKDKLALCNNIINAALKLLKEVETPYSIVGFSLNPTVSGTVRILVLSAFSAVLSDLLGFKVAGLWKLSKL